MGYHLAGFDVVGVDIEPQPNYPFEFWQEDAIGVLRIAKTGGLLWDGGPFDAIHASPPCQHYSEMSRCQPGLAATYPDLVAPVRELLIATGTPWVIENVPGAPMAGASDLFGNHGTTLCGTMFGLRVYRHRLFECSFPVEAPGQCNHSRRAWNPHNVAGRKAMNDEGMTGDVEIPWRNELGVGWMGRYEAREAIPPAYTEFIGTQLLAHLAVPATP